MIGGVWLSCVYSHRVGGDLRSRGEILSDWRQSADVVVVVLHSGCVLFVYRLRLGSPSNLWILLLSMPYHLSSQSNIALQSMNESRYYDNTLDC